MLRYLNSTVDFCIEYIKPTGAQWADAPVPRVITTLELYSDASHAPEGGRSCQAIVILWLGMTICWECGKQPFVTLSSAEAELVAVIAGIVASESVGGVIEEIIGDDVVISALCDNQASVRAFANGNLGWRNRHLRMRAAAGRERIQAGSLVVTYVPGSIQLADLATKALARPRIFELLDLLHIRSYPVEETNGEGGRILSRLVLEGFNRPLVTPQALAGLALIAAIPRVRGQPHIDGHEVVIQGFGVVLGFIVLFVVWLWVWFCLNCFERDLGTECFSGFGDFDGWFQDERVTELIDKSTALELSGLRSTSTVDPDFNPDDDFTEEEWLVAQQKLRDEELRTGLTLVQRARLRRQLRAGGVVDPPNFLQRYGPAPSWYSCALEDRGNDRGVSTGVVNSSAEGSEHHTGCDEALSEGNDLAAVQVQDSRARVGCSLACPTIAEGMSDEGDDIGDTGSADMTDQGEQILMRGLLVSEFFEAVTSSIICSIFGYVVFRGINWGLLRVVSVGFWNNPVIAVLGQFADTGRFQAVLNGLRYVVVLRFVRSEGEGVWLPVSVETDAVDWTNSGFDLQNRGSLDCASDPDSRNRGSLDCASDPDSRNRGSSACASDPDSQNRGREDLQDRWGTTGFGGSGFQGRGSSSSGDRVCVPMSASGSRSRGHVPDFSFDVGTASNVQVGGSSSSTDAHVASVGPAAGSGSHGFNAPHLEGVYEDYFSEDDSLEDFPLVGVWLKVHFVAQVFSIQGPRLLSCLGHRTPEWAAVRCASIALRYALIGTVADMLREGPWAIWFQGPQWHQAVDEYICSGEIPGSVGFGGEYVGPDAAQAYLQAESDQSDDRQDDPALDEIPHVVRDPPYRIGRLFVDDDEWRDESGDSSTTEPSTVNGGTGLESAVGEDLTENQVLDNGGPGGLGYQAGEGVLLVNYGDDQGEVPLPGWTEEMIQGVAESLNTGDWSTFDDVVAQLPVEDRGVQLRFGAARRRRVRTWCWVVYVGIIFGIVCWFLRRGIPQAQALTQEICEGPPSSSKSIQLYRTRPVAEEGVVPMEDLSCGCEGFTRWLFGWSVALLGVWEFLKLVSSRVLTIRDRRYDEATQTFGQFVPLPLTEAVPRRANILYCLWKGGHRIDIEDYPERIRTEFEGYVGAWLVSREEGFVSSPDSSD